MEDLLENYQLMEEPKEIQPCITELENFFFDVHLKTCNRLLDFTERDNLRNLKRFWNVFSTETDHRTNNTHSDWCLSLTDTLFYRFTYIQRKSVIISSAVAFHFLNTFQNNPLIMKSILQKKTVNIVSIGCGPASDAVALVKVLASLAQCENIQLDFRVTIISFDAKWAATCFAALTCLEQFQAATWKIDYVQADLFRPLLLRTSWAIKDADIVSMVDYEENIKMNLVDKNIKKVINAVQPGCVFFTLGYRTRRDFSRYPNVLKNFVLIYEEINDYYVLDLCLIKKMSIFFKQSFHSCQFYCELLECIRVWKKCPIKKKEKNVLHPSFVDKRERFNVMRDYLNSSSWLYWENIFLDKLTEQCWTPKQQQKLLYYQKMYRNVLIGKYIQANKNFDVVREDLLTLIKTQVILTDSDLEKYNGMKLKVNLEKMNIFKMFCGNLYKVFLTKIYTGKKYTTLYNKIKCQ